MGFNLADLIACLDIRRMGADVYEGGNYPLKYRRIFGGQVLAQGIRSLHESGGGKQIKSITQYFPREGDVEEPVTYRVDKAHEGRTFATSAVRAQQGERTIGVMTASLHSPEPGIERNQHAPDVVPPGWAEAVENPILPWEVRVVEGGDLSDPTPREPTYRYWMRIPDLADYADPEQQWVHQALLAHASEPTIIGTALFPLHGVSQADAQVKFTSAVTTHSIWFHADVRMDEWVLVDQQSPTMNGSRVFGRADVWNRDGRLVASVAQESMVRFRED